MTSKEQYENSLRTILDIVMDMPNLTDGDWKAISDETSVLWKLKDEIGRISVIRQQVERNTYYQHYIKVSKEKRVVSAQSKAVDERYICCTICKRIVAKDYLTTHRRESKICIDNRLALEMERRTLKTKKVVPAKMMAFFEKYRKTYNVANYLVENHLAQLKSQKRCKDVWEGVGMYSYYL